MKHIVLPRVIDISKIPVLKVKEGTMRECDAVLINALMQANETELAEKFRAATTEDVIDITITDGEYVKLTKALRARPLWVIGLKSFTFNE